MIDETLGMPDLAAWQVRWFKVAGLRKVIARRNGVTYVYAELAGGDWYVTKLKGGKVIVERQFESMPRNLQWVFVNRAPV